MTGTRSGCSICSSSKLAAIHAALDGGASISSTARALGIAPSTLKRHCAGGHRAAGAPPSKNGPLGKPAIKVTGPGTPSKGRGGSCAVCRDPRVDQFNAAIVNGDGAQTIEVHFRPGPSDDSIRRHATKCIPAQVQAAQAARLTTTAKTVADRAEILIGNAEALLAHVQGKADRDKSAKDWAGAINAMRGVLELLGKLTGELGADVEVRLVSAPAWNKAKLLIVNALTAYPEALAAVLTALATAEA